MKAYSTYWSLSWRNILLWVLIKLKIIFWCGMAGLSQAKAHTRHHVKIRTGCNGLLLNHSPTLGCVTLILQSLFYSPFLMFNFFTLAKLTPKLINCWRAYRNSPLLPWFQSSTSMRITSMCYPFVLRYMKQISWSSCGRSRYMRCWRTVTYEHIHFRDCWWGSCSMLLTWTSCSTIRKLNTPKLDRL